MSGAAATNIAIDAGSASAVGSWLADTDYTTSGAGGVASVTNAINTSLVANAPPQSVYQNQRYAPTITYTIPKLTNSGAYTVTLHFVESYFTAPGQRVFSIKINGVPVLSNFDIFQSAGGENIAISKTFAATATSAGNLGVQLTASVNNASIAAISVTAASGVPTPAPSPTPQPALDIDAGGAASGNWLADADYTSTGNGGVATVANAIGTSLVTSPAPQAVYQSQRYAPSLTYAIPGFTANGAYTVRLHFVESYWTGKGQRVFNVAINGASVLPNFDIFQSAGGENIAVAKQFAVNADATGKITIALVSSVDNATVAGIEILGGSGVIIPTPTPAPTTAPTSTPVSGYPIYSSYFTGNSPYHHHVATLLSYGASVRNDGSASNYWNAFGGPFTLNPSSQSGGPGPLYSTASGQSSYQFSCPSYFGNVCNSNGMTTHFPAGAYPETGSDGHLSMFDTVNLHGEVDGWGGCTLGSGSEHCTNGGWYPFSGNGLSSDGYSCADAGCSAFGLHIITAGDLLSGTIKHAIGLENGCIDANGVYPATPGKGSDSPCGSFGGAEPNASYGDLIAIKPSVDLNAAPYSSYSPYCKEVVVALQTYGGYTLDSTGGSTGVYANIEYMDVFSGNNPWYTTILPQMVQYGDASGSGTSFSWTSCLNRVRAGDIEIVQVNQGGNSALPPTSQL